MPTVVAGLSAKTTVVASAVISAPVIVLIALPPPGFPPLRGMAAPGGSAAVRFPIINVERVSVSGSVRIPHFNHYQIKKKYKAFLQASQIYNLLRNKTYLGLIVYDNEIYQGKHEPIITNDLFERAQKILPCKERDYIERKKLHRYDYLLTGLTFCSCGSRLIPASAKSGLYHYYICKNPDCGKKRVKAEKIEQEAISTIQKIGEISEDVIKRTVEKIKIAQAEYLKRIIYRRIFAGLKIS